MKFHLKHPIQYGSETIVELDLKERITSDTMRGIPMGSFTWDDIAKIAVRLAGYPDSAAKNMHAADIIAVQAVIADFLGIGPGTGTGP